MSYLAFLLGALSLGQGPGSRTFSWWLLSPLAQSAPALTGQQEASLGKAAEPPSVTLYWSCPLDTLERFSFRQIKRRQLGRRRPSASVSDTVNTRDPTLPASDLEDRCYLVIQQSLPYLLQKAHCQPCECELKLGRLRDWWAAGRRPAGG